MTTETFNWDSIMGNLETHINRLENGFLEKDNNKSMSEVCFWMNSDKSIVIDMSQIVGVIKLDKPTSCGDRIYEYAVYTTIEKDIAFPISKNDHLSLIEALQETYDYCEMEEDEDAENEETDEIPGLFDNKIKW